MIGSGNADTEHVTRAASLVWSALDRLEEGVAVFDQRLELVYCNAPFRTLRDYPESVCRPGAHIANLYRHNAARGDYGSGDPEAAVAKRVALARTRKARAFDQRLADGTVLHVRYAPVPGGGLLFTYEDVSAKRRTEAALQSSERRAALVAEATTEGIYEWYIDAGEFHPSNRLMDLFGIQGEGINPSQWDWNRRVHPDDFEHYRIQLAAALKDDRARYACEYRVRREDGEYMWVMDRGVVSERDDAGRAVRFIGSLLDITDIKAAQERMRISEERYALAVEAVNEGVYDWDIAADSVYFSNKVRAVLGLTPEQLARPSDWSGRIHPDDAARYRAAMAAHLK